ncbi:MAG: putative beta-lysine N-acetyltransferase [Desulfovibrio sp.]
MRPDRITQFGNSVVQHGPLNGRAYLMRLDPEDSPHIVSRLERLAEDNGYTKIFAKVPEGAANDFAEAGYRTEAVVPGFFNGEECGLFMGRYFAEWRRVPANAGELRRVLRTARENVRPCAENGLSRPEDRLPGGYRLRRLGPEHAEDMAALYSEVFSSYPFPIHEPDYLRETMADDVCYFAACCDGAPAALCSAEVDRDAGVAEMTDFATLPAHRGLGLAGHLLSRAERAMSALGLSTLYTIARAASYGMNITFARAGYDYSGILPNNTNISGGLESMNVWHKSLD